MVKTCKNILYWTFVLSIMYSCSKAIVDEENPLEWMYGKNEFNIEIDGAIRNFLIHVPELYDGSKEVPIVFMLHGSSGTGNKFYNISRWVEKSDEEGFIAVFPTALEYPILPSGNLSTKWSSDGVAKDVVEGTVIKDDVPFFEGLIELLISSFKVDQSRLYICGFSNGGGFVKSVIVPRMGEVFAAACASGGVGSPIPIDIEGERNIPFFNISGSVDHKIFEAIGSNEELPLKSEDIETHEFLWPALQNMADGLQLSYDYVEVSLIPKYNQLIFADNLSDQNNEFVFMMVNDLDHNFPNESNNPQKIVAVDILWPWFQKWVL